MKLPAGVHQLSVTSSSLTLGLHPLLLCPPSSAGLMATLLQHIHPHFDTHAHLSLIYTSVLNLRCRYVANRNRVPHTAASPEMWLHIAAMQATTTVIGLLDSKLTPFAIYAQTKNRVETLYMCVSTNKQAYGERRGEKDRQSWGQRREAAGGRGQAETERGERDLLQPQTNYNVLTNTNKHASRPQHPHLRPAIGRKEG